MDDPGSTTADGPFVAADVATRNGDQMKPVRSMTFLLLMIVFLTSSDEAGAGARSSRPLKTGQTSCWDSFGNPINCAGTGQDGDLRRGEGRSYVDLGDGTIRDVRTALTWERLNNDGSIHDKDNTYSWDEAFAKVQALNSSPCFASFCDWRMPNMNELLTLVDWEATPGRPGIASAFDQGCTGFCSSCSCTKETDSGAYFSSTTDPGDPEYAQGYVFGREGPATILKTADFYFRAVRGGRR